MRKRDILLNDYLGTNCPQVSMQTESGKIRNILAGTTKQVLRIIQSIPSQKAEPFKIWLKHLLLSCQKHTIRKILSRTKQLRNKAVRLLAMPARALKSRVAVQWLVQKTQKNYDSLKKIISNSCLSLIQQHKQKKLERTAFFLIRKWNGNTDLSGGYWLIDGQTQGFKIWLKMDQPLHI